MRKKVRIGIYINRMEHRTTFKIKTGYYLEFLTHETMKLLEITKSKITKNENGQNDSLFRNHWSIINTLYCC